MSFMRAKETYLNRNSLRLILIPSVAFTEYVTNNAKKKRAQTYTHHPCRVAARPPVHEFVQSANLEAVHCGKGRSEDLRFKDCRLGPHVAEHRRTGEFVPRILEVQSSSAPVLQQCLQQCSKCSKCSVVIALLPLLTCLDNVHVPMTQDTTKFLGKFPVQTVQTANLVYMACRDPGSTPNPHFSTATHRC